MPTARQPIKLYGDAVSLNFEEAPLSEVVHSVLGDILELDYIVEHPVQGAVTLRTRSPIPRDHEGSGNASAMSPHPAPGVRQCSRALGCHLTLNAPPLIAAPLQNLVKPHRHTA